LIIHEVGLPKKTSITKAPDRAYKKISKEIAFIKNNNVIFIAYKE
jgi:hypothetical protein